VCIDPRLWLTRKIPIRIPEGIIKGKKFYISNNKVPAIAISILSSTYPLQL
jgi:hypothetical protein